MDSQRCHHHQQLSIREIGGEQKRMRKTLPGSSYHLCRARESGGDGDKQTKRTGLAGFIFLFAAGNFLITIKDNFIDLLL